MKYYKIPANELEKYLINETDNSSSNHLPIVAQRDPRWANLTLGFGPTKIGSHGCKLCCFSMMVNIPPNILNDHFKKNGVFVNDLISDEKASKSLNLKFIKRETDINKMPKADCIKEVRLGKSQHFVFRVYDKTDSFSNSYGAYIIDPWEGKRLKANHYPFVSYRIFGY